MIGANVVSSEMLFPSPITESYLYFIHNLIDEKQEGLAVASIARDDPSPLPGMHRDHNVPACTASRSARPHALRAGARAKSGLEFET